MSWAFATYRVIISIVDACGGARTYNLKSGDGWVVMRGDKLVHLAHLNAKHDERKEGSLRVRKGFLVDWVLGQNVVNIFKRIFFLILVVDVHLYSLGQQCCPGTRGRLIFC